MNTNLPKSQKKNINFIKKLLGKIKENFMCDETKNEIKNEFLEPLYIEIRNFILPHYVIFIILLVIIIILLLYQIFITSRYDK
jgi:hypothetical protein